MYIVVRRIALTSCTVIKFCKKTYIRINQLHALDLHVSVYGSGTEGVKVSACETNRIQTCLIWLVLYQFELFGSHGHSRLCRNEIKSFVTVTNGSAE